jgi:tetratricopeptide (TPR) repeat protein
VLKHVLTIEPNNIQTNRALGFFYIAMNRTPEAEPFFQNIAKTAKTTQASLGLADFYTQAKRVDEAKKVLGQVAETRDGYVPATLRLATFDVLEGQRAQAMTRTREVLEKHPGDLATKLFMTRLLMLDGKRDDAIREASAIAAHDGNGRFAAEAHQLLAQVYTDLGRIADAIKSYEQVLRLHPRPFAATLALASLHLQTNDLSKATTYADQVLGIVPGSPEARAIKARVLLAKGERESAGDLIAELQKQYPKAPAVLNLVALQALARNDLKAARAAYEESATSRGNPEALMGIIRLDVASGQSALAIRKIEETLKVAAPTPAFLALAGSAYATAGDFKKAEEVWRRAVDADPMRLQGYALLAQLYVQQNRLDEAVDNFKEMIKRDEKSVPANTMLGMLFDMQKRTKEAEEQYRKTLSFDSRAAVAANNLAWIYSSRADRLDEALQLAQVAVQQLPDEPNVNDTIGWIYYKKNLPAQAVRHLEISVEKGPQVPDNQFHLGMAYVMAGEVEKAKTTLERALKVDPKSSYAEDARAALAKLKL